MTIIADKEPKICCQDVALANLFLSADLFNMSRNIRIILMMLCLTVIIQLVIYYEGKLLFLVVLVDAQSLVPHKLLNR